MLIVLCVIGALSLGVGIFVYSKYRTQLYRDDKEWVYYLLNSVGIMLLCASIIAAIIVGANYSEHIIIDDKIELYKNENAKIEQQMSVIIDDYINYESNTFEKLKGEDSITLVTLFPELKSNELVNEQIEVYVLNNTEIKKLECERLQYKVYSWWLFFGK